MPIYKGKSNLKADDSFIRRLDKGKTNLRRVYKGSYLKDENSLIWGLYDLILQVGDDLSDCIIKANNWIKTYVYGIEYTLPEEGKGISYQMIGDPIRNYNHKWYGWYEGNKYAKSIGMDPSIIKKTDHRNLDLYSMWKQKKFTYGGTWHYYVTEFDPRTSGPDEGDPNYMAASKGGNNPWYVSTAGSGPAWPGCVMPNCTGYVWGRYLELGDSLSSSLVGPMSGGDCTPMWNYYSSYQSSEPKVGAVAVWSGHVAIVESIDDAGRVRMSNSYWSSSGGTYFVMTGPWTREQMAGHGYGTYYGFLNIFSGGKKRVDMTKEETDCPDQQNPDAPLPEIPDPEGYDAEWDNLYKKTYLRTNEWIEKISNWGSWLSYDESSWSSTWPEREVKLNEIN